MKNSITPKYLTGLGFEPFCEDGELLFYSRFLPDKGGTVSLSPTVELKDGNTSKDWILKIKTIGKATPAFGSIDLSCACDNTEMLEKIFRFFTLPMTDGKRKNRSDAIAFIVENRIAHPRCRCCKVKLCSEACENNVDNELIELVIQGKINEHNLKEYQ